SRDGGSTSTIEIVAVPSAQPANPAPTGRPAQPGNPPQPGNQQPTTPAAPPPNQPPRSLGGVDLERYCQDGWGLHAILRESNAYGWRCGGDGRPDQSISVDDACVQQYGAPSRSR